MITVPPWRASGAGMAVMSLACTWVATWPSTTPGVVAQALTSQMDRVPAGDRVVPAAQRFPIDRPKCSRCGARQCPHPVQDGDVEGRRSRAPPTRPEMSWQGDTIGQGQERRNPRLLGTTEAFALHSRVRPADDGAQGDRSDIEQPMPHGAVNARIEQISNGALHDEAKRRIHAGAPGATTGAISLLCRQAPHNAITLTTIVPWLSARYLGCTVDAERCLPLPIPTSPHEPFGYVPSPPRDSSACSSLSGFREPFPIMSR
jgi:hypothetical protein